MPHPRISVADWNLKDFQSICKLEVEPAKELSTSFLLQKGSPLSQTSTPDVATLEYLDSFEHEEELNDPTENVEEDAEEDEEEEEEILKGDVVCKVGPSSLSSYRLTAAQLEDERLLEEFWNLKVVDISDNQLKNLRNLGALPYLQIVNASNNLLETILEIAPPLPGSIKEVDFSHNKISSVVELTNYWSLTHINLSYNELTSTQGFSGLNFLQDLDLSHNKIATLSTICCPNLFYLNLGFNEFESINEDYVGCNNLRVLNLQKNKLSDIRGLKYFTELTELDVTENNIDDVTQFEHLKPLLNLSRLKISPNPITSMPNLRLVLVHGLSQLLWLDETYIQPSELRAATNTLNPSIQKLAYLDYSAILLGRTCRSSSNLFDSFCRSRPIPPILLIVGPPRSHCHTLALLLKEKFRNHVHLGGVHSTATTIEGSHPNVDIPISYETFQEMKNKGEFLSTCEILGRICGFAYSQVERAAEKSGLLVAAVPLKTALALRHWNLNPKLVLVLPSTLPEFPQDHERDEAIRRSNVIENSQDPFPRRKSRDGNEEDVDEASGEEHLVNFQEMLSVVPSEIDVEDSEAVLDGKENEEDGDENENENENEDETEHNEHEDSENPEDKTRQHSILRHVPHFEVGAKFEDAEDDELDDNEMEASLIRHQRMSGKVDSTNQMGGRDSHVHISSQLIADATHDQEQRKQGRIKSIAIAPGMERYSLEDDDEDEEIAELIKMKSSEEEEENEMDENVSQDLAQNVAAELSKFNKNPTPNVPPPMASSSQSFSIFQPNELYSNFQPQIPGLIDDVMDKTDLCDVNLAGDNIVLDAIMRLKEEIVEAPPPPPPEIPPPVDNKKRCGKNSVSLPKKKSREEVEEQEEEEDGEEQEDEDEDEGNQEEDEDEQEFEQDEEEQEQDIDQVENEEDEEEEQDDGQTVNEQEENEQQNEQEQDDQEQEEVEQDFEENDEQFDEMDEEIYPDNFDEEEAETPESEKRPSKRRSSKKRSSVRIQEPVHMTDMTEETEEECVETPPPLISHKEAMTASILQTKELYSKFHSENPGFFHTVIDTADLCESYQVVENLASDALNKLKSESEASMERPQMEKSYSGANQVDAKYFMGDRIQKMKDFCASWSRGRGCGGGNQVPTFQLNPSRMEQSQLLKTQQQQQSTGRRNLLGPSIHRPLITLKMRKLVELTEKRAKCTNFQKTSNCNFQCK